MKIALHMALAVGIVVLECVAAWAQFNGNVQGDVRDTSGAVIADAAVILTNSNTLVEQTTKADSSGVYHFVSLAPGDYKISAKARGFTTTSISITLETGQTLNIPITVKISSTAENITVTGEAPVLDTADSRTQLTVDSRELTDLPLQGRNLLALTSVAPGVTGLGLAPGGAPGSAADNFSTETLVNASANGRGNIGNMYVVDGMDVTSDIRPGVLNLVPNPDSIQETSIQTNTFSTEYGRASSVQMVMTTKSGTNQFHANFSDYFSNQNLWALTEFSDGQRYFPFHSNNFSGSIGGPILPKHQFFFFFSIEPLRETTSTANAPQTFEDAQFTSWAQQNFPGTIGTSLLTNFKPSGVTMTSAETAAQVFGNSACGTPATANIPCGLPVIDNGLFNSSSYRNGLQWNTRIDKYFSKDRVYGNVFRTTLTAQIPSVRPGFISTAPYITDSVQVNETHTFSNTLVNEGAFGYYRVQGIYEDTSNFKVPFIYVFDMGATFGQGFAQGNFIQHHFQWRDVLNKIAGSHSLKFGYQGGTGDDLVPDQNGYRQPTFYFTDPLALAQDQPYLETGLAYNPLTGKPTPGGYDWISYQHGLFVQDTWKARHNLTLTYGLRWDDAGNPYQASGIPAYAFHLGAGQTFSEQVSNGFIQQQSGVLNHVPMSFSPRAGFSWDPASTGNWVVRGGFGIYSDWPPLSETEQLTNGNPPGFITPVFLSTGGTSAPIFALGTSASIPGQGYPFPALASTTLDSHGGLVGVQEPVGGVDGNLKQPTTYNYTATLERKLVKDVVASVGYSGSRSSNQIPQASTNYSPTSNCVADTCAGPDINVVAGDLIQHSGVLTRLNQSFGSIAWAYNGAIGRYNALIVSAHGRFGHRGSFNVSYTRSKATDDAQIYPTLNISQYYGTSQWDVPNRFSLSASYELPGVNSGQGFWGRLGSGWTISDITILQSGTPFVVYTTNPFQGTSCTSINVCGDYNADGDNYDFPNVTSYSHGVSRRAYLTGIFSLGQFTVPTAGTEGNEMPYRFRAPGYANSDISLLKTAQITERLRFQLRCDAFNVFNRPNLGAVDGNLVDATFGRVLSQYNPRWFQLGASISF